MCARSLYEPGDTMVLAETWLSSSFVGQSVICMVSLPSTSNRLESYHLLGPDPILQVVYVQESWPGFGLPTRDIRIEDM